MAVKHLAQRRPSRFKLVFTATLAIPGGERPQKGLAPTSNPDWFAKLRLPT